jgi:transposase-like protein
MLVLIGATPEGKKELVGFQVGQRESAQSWRELLADLKGRGLAIAPEIAVGDGALGFWKAIDEAWPDTRHQRCWVHKTSNIPNKLPKSVHPAAKADLREIPLSRHCYAMHCRAAGRPRRVSTPRPPWRPSQPGMGASIARPSIA